MRSALLSVAVLVLLAGKCPSNPSPGPQPQPQPPPGPSIGDPGDPTPRKVKSISAGQSWMDSEVACAIDENDAPICFKPDFRQTLAAVIGKKFAAISAGVRGTVCGIDANGKALCFEGSKAKKLTAAQVASMPGPFSMVSQASFVTCTLDKNRILDCFSLDETGIPQAAPSDKFIQISVAPHGVTCGVLLNTDKLMCWACNTVTDIASAIGLKIGEISLNKSVNQTGCLWDWDDNLPTCLSLGNDAAFPSFDAKIAATAFYDISVSANKVCGVTKPDGKLVCFKSPPAPDRSNTSLKTERLKTISVGQDLMCGIKIADDTIACWKEPQTNAEQYSVLPSSIGG